MKKSSKKSFKKFYVKRDPRTSKLMINKKGEPEVGDFIRNVRITQAQADELGLSWKQLGFIFVADKSEEEAKAKAAEEEAKAKAKAIIAAKELKFDATNIEEVKAKIKALVDAGLIEKPHPATGIEKLNLSINEVK